MPNHHELESFIWQIADLLRGPYRPPQYERVMLPMIVLRRFDCVLADTKAAVLRKHEQAKEKYKGEALDKVLDTAAKQRFHNHSPLDFAKLKGDPDHIDKHLTSYINGFSANVRRIFDFFELTNEIEKMRESNILYLVVSTQLKRAAWPSNPTTTTEPHHNPTPLAASATPALSLRMGAAINPFRRTQIDRRATSVRSALSVRIPAMHIPATLEKQS